MNNPEKSFRKFLLLWSGEFISEIPLLIDEGVLADSVGKIIGTGSGRGTGFLIVIAGMLLSITSIILYNVKAVEKLESRGDLYVLQNNPQ